MNREKCPECHDGFLYKKLERRTGFTIKICFVCGHYWNDSNSYGESAQRLFREYFPQQTRWIASPEIDRRFSSPEIDRRFSSPEIDRRFSSPEDLTKPYFSRI